MDLAASAREVWVLLEHTTKEGKPRILERCSYPLTARNVVTRIYTDLAVIEVTKDALLVMDLAEGVSFQQVQALTEARLTRRPERPAATPE